MRPQITALGIHALFVSLGLFASLGCSSEALDATPEHTAKALEDCKRYDDYKPGDGEEHLSRLDEYCAKTPCPWRKKIAAVCNFYGPRTTSHYEFHTTIPKDDTMARTKMCEGLRDSGVFAMITPLHLVCRDGKRCTRCGVSGGHR